MMIGVQLRYEDGRQESRRLPLPLDIGRDPASGLRIKGWRVARRHARIEACDGGIFLEDYGALTGTYINGRRVSRHGPLQAGDEIEIGPCQIVIDTIDGPDAAQVPASAAEGAMPVAPPMASPGSGRLSLVPGSEQGPPSTGSPALDARGTKASPSAGDGHARDDMHALEQALASTGVSADRAYRQSVLAQRRRLHASLLEALDLRRRDVANMSDDALRSEAAAVLAPLIDQDGSLPPDIDRQHLLGEVIDEAIGLGPLEPLLADASISEIMVNRFDEIFVETGGRLRRHAATFSSEQAVLGVVERIVSPLGRRIDESSPMVDARLRDGSRVNAVIPPIALRGASLTIRKFPRQRPDMDHLLRAGALDAAMRDFLVLAVGHKKNIVVSGGTGSGKTTLLNILSNFIPDGERIVTIEDAAELRLMHANLVGLEARPANLEGRGRIEMRDLVRNALRMRPDRIVIGECRGGEAFDMLAAMNTGHEGSLTTLHANTPRDALARLETMILMAGMDLPLAAVREHIASSIHLIVQQARLGSGRRLITDIVEITGMESGKIQTQTLFRHVAGPPAGFQGMGVAPDCFPATSPGLPGLSMDLFTGFTPDAPRGDMPQGGRHGVAAPHGGELS